MYYVACPRKTIILRDVIPERESIPPERKQTLSGGTQRCCYLFATHSVASRHVAERHANSTFCNGKNCEWNEGTKTKLESFLSVLSIVYKTKYLHNYQPKITRMPCSSTGISLTYEFMHISERICIFHIYPDMRLISYVKAFLSLCVCTYIFIYKCGFDMNVYRLINAQ